jgi:hypothetical protein
MSTTVAEVLATVRRVSSLILIESLKCYSIETFALTKNVSSVRSVVIYDHIVGIPVWPSSKDCLGGEEDNI